MAPRFGTSGLRGLAADLTDDVVAAHVRAFLSACPHGGAVHVGQDLRDSTPRIASAVRRALIGAGLRAIDSGILPTPALALAAMSAGHAAIMVTGSHIPADRNGLKFYVPHGEITKSDEARILDAMGEPMLDVAGGRAVADNGALARYAARYESAFGPDSLSGLRVGIYQHSSVARDILVQIVRALGAEAIPLARSDRFVPVDTEAVDAATRKMLDEWAATHRMDAIISTDGDGDRPMLADAKGRIVPGDVLGALAARALGATHVATPITSNTQIDRMGFERIERTRIGSPHVIAAMESALTAQPGTRIAGYEANGGFLLGFGADGPAGPLAPLMTRDAVLPLLGVLFASRHARQPVAGLVADLPHRFTAADRLTDVPLSRAREWLATLQGDSGARAAFFADLGPEAALDLTDGLRVTLRSGDVVHLRLSGNAPELRCYAESGTSDAAAILVRGSLDRAGKCLT